MLGAHTRNILEYDRVLEMISAYAVTEAGAAHVLSLEPVDDLPRIGEEFDRLAEMVSVTAGGEANFVPPEVPVLREQMARLAKPGMVLECPEVIACGKLLQAAASVRAYILRREDSLPRLSLLAGKLEPFEQLELRIRRTFDENGEVKSSASPLLGKLRRDARLVRERIEESLDRIREKLAAEGSAGENFVTLRQERYVLAIRRDEVHSCPGIIQGESASGNTLFIEPEQAVKLNNRLKEIEMDIRREVVKILASLSDQLRAGYPGLQTNIGVLTLLDSLYARARYADRYCCSRPRYSKNNTLALKKARHPLLLARFDLEARRGEKVVPLDLELSPDERTLLVSGPNAGGKTVLLKTVGVIVLMAQAGIFPPVDQDTVLPLFDRVFAAIGDEQSIDKDLSTFSSHVSDLITAVRGGGPGSLVLLDEVGVGTDPAEGVALASAVLEYLTGHGCLTLSTTHYGELKILYERIDGLVNGSLEFDTGKMKPTFRFRKGIPGQSYGLAIARNLGLEEEVLERALNFMNSETVNVNAYLQRLEQQQKKLEQGLAEVRDERRSLEVQLDALKAERGALAQKSAELWEKEKRFAEEMAGKKRELLLEARKEVEEVISRLRARHLDEQEKAERAARRTLEKRIESLKKETEPAPEAASIIEPGDARLNPGDRVRVLGLDLEGEVLEGPDSAGKFTVVAGRARMILGAGEMLRLAGKSGKKRKKSHVSLAGVDETAGPVPNELDLRGLRADEVDQALGRFLDDAVLAGIGTVVVIHGKGTGALRSRVARLLELDSRVESFRTGAWNEGGIGATIATLH